MYIWKGLKLDNLESLEQVSQSIIYPLEYLNYPKYELSKSEKERVSHGIALDLNSEDGLIILTEKDRLIAIAQIENKKAKMAKVFI